MSKAQQTPAFKWMLILSAALLVPALIGLGFWQIDRAEQKQQLIQSWSEQQVQTRLPELSEFSSDQYMNLDLQGYFDRQHYFLLENRFRDGNLGFEVVVPFSTVFGERVLVNLGWIKAENNRSEKPMVSIPQSQISIQGGARLIRPGFTLGVLSVDQTWPIRIQQLDATYISQLLSTEIFPIEIRVKKTVIPALSLDWPVSVMMPEKHLAYALQWFAMALALLVLIIWNWRYMQREVRYE
ncbi:SURF1 family protein [Neptuniibacter sp.]|uniref:SURF1 family protein n=1 Tax=Neptuniibacter sp. TaxID=1962643 RepID=UPI003B5B769C